MTKNLKNMLNFSHFLNLPFIFAGLLAFVVFLYVLLDGFDLGIGIIFPFAPTNKCRDRMMNSIAPFWDGNETWLVFAGMLLFAAFPLAYSIIAPSFYIPIILMLLGLIFRGVAFEFRFKAHSKFERKIWDYSFHFGSLIATLFQGVMLGAFIQGSGEWFNSFSLAVGLAVIFGYSLLGSAWLIMKTDGRTQIWSRGVACYVLFFVVMGMVMVSFWTPLLESKITTRWFSKPNIFYLTPICVTAFLTAALLVRSLVVKKEKLPFFLTIFLFILCYAGIAITIYPYILPYKLSFAEAAAAPTSLSFLLIGVALTLPMILVYSAFSYHVFRGKSSHHTLY